MVVRQYRTSLVTIYILSLFLGILCLLSVLGIVRQTNGDE